MGHRWERWTDRARKVLAVADHKSTQRKETCIGTEHLLLAIMDDNTSVAFKVLKNLGVCQCKVEGELKTILQDNVSTVEVHAVEGSHRR